MEIRKLAPQERIQTRPLYEEVFPEDSPEFVSYYYTEKIKDNEIYVVEADGGIRAMLHLNPYTVLVNQQEQKAHYIVAVATEKVYRSRGYMTALLHKALKDLYQQGESFTYLMPAAEEIYLPHGFRTVYQQHFHRVEKDSVQPETEVSLATEEDCQELADFAASELAKKEQVYVKRTAAYYRRLLQEYQCDGDSLLLYRAQGHMVDCRINMPCPLGKQWIMIRIVDAEKLLGSLKVSSPISVCFQLQDPIIQENNRCVVLSGTEETGIQVHSGGDTQAEGVLPIAALGSFLFGAENVEALSQEEGVTGSALLWAELKKICPLSRIFLNEAV